MIALVRRVMLTLVILALTAGGFGAGYYVGHHTDEPQVPLVKRVPDLVGLGTEGGVLAAARHELAAHGLRLGTVGRSDCTHDENGLVVRQKPPAGAVIQEGATVSIVVGDSGMLVFDSKPCLG